MKKKINDKKIITKLKLAFLMTVKNSLVEACLAE